MAATSIFKLIHLGMIGSRSLRSIPDQRKALIRGYRMGGEKDTEGEGKDCAEQTPPGTISMCLTGRFCRYRSAKLAELHESYPCCSTLTALTKGDVELATRITIFSRNYSFNSKKRLLKYPIELDCNSKSCGNVQAAQAL